MNFYFTGMILAVIASMILLVIEHFEGLRKSTGEVVTIIAFGAVFSWFTFIALSFMIAHYSYYKVKDSL